ncbi:hypothetical protein OEG86_11655 [Hoeflea alexandrii]|uniref:oxidoreductase C-terminal domain-containing protein n=1 Tax=Hoeflea alexandrii TaxID=288436 RepID=UPI00226DDF3C|nr:oxidoreductase C-terminal domain-containing protein [Hoeflea alexandrii]MCY0152782.1 hypothetical protein [Hoeflea alexandrii]
MINFAAGRLISVETVNSAAAHMSARRLLASGRPVAQAELAAHNYNLVDYARAV